MRVHGRVGAVASSLCFRGLPEILGQGALRLCEFFRVVHVVGGTHIEIRVLFFRNGWDRFRRSFDCRS